MGSNPRVRVHGPMWQLGCEDCGWMSDVSSTRKAAESEKSEHDCLLYSLVFSFDGEEEGVMYVTHRPTLRQFKLVEVSDGQ